MIAAAAMTAMAMPACAPPLRPVLVELDVDDELGEVLEVADAPVVLDIVAVICDDIEPTAVVRATDGADMTCCIVDNAAGPGALMVKSDGSWQFNVLSVLTQQFHSLPPLL